MMRGRKPHSTRRRELDGNPSKRPMNDTEPQPPDLDADGEAVPELLRGDATATAEWLHLAPMLRKTRQISEADRNCLLAVCQQWAIYTDALAQLRRRGGPIIAAPSGYPIISPWLAVANKALTNCTKLWAELGLTPSSRSRVKEVGGGPGETDDFSEFDQPIVGVPKTH
jgi:P27 family predicted phage terminase small subunit